VADASNRVSERQDAREHLRDNAMSVIGIEYVVFECLDCGWEGSGYIPAATGFGHLPAAPGTSLSPARPLPLRPCKAAGVCPAALLEEGVSGRWDSNPRLPAWETGLAPHG
jgi:hypothetical protein